MDTRKIEKIVKEFFVWLVEARGKSHSTAHNYSQVARKLLIAHPEGADYAEMTSFLAANPSSNGVASSKLFAEYAFDNLALRFSVKPEVPGTPVPISELHRTIFALLDACNPPIPPSVCWDEVPSVDEWRPQGIRLNHEQITSVNLMLWQLRKAGRGSPLVFAKEEGSKYSFFSAEELAYPEVDDNV